MQIKKKRKFGDEGKVSNDDWGSNCLLTANADKLFIFCNDRIYQASFSEQKRPGEVKSVTSKLL
jgi:hypothetical protein